MADAGKLVSVSATRKLLYLPITCSCENLKDYTYELRGAYFITVLAGGVHINGAYLNETCEKKSLYISSPPEGPPTIIFPSIYRFSCNPIANKYTIETGNTFGDPKTNNKRALIVLDSLSEESCMLKQSPMANTTALWVEAMIDILLAGPATVLVSGSKNVGKSMFCRLFAFLAQSFCGTSEDVLLVDLDLGQPEFGAPGTVSLTKMISANPNPPSSRVQRGLDCYPIFVGSLSLTDFPRLYQSATSELAKKLKTTNGVRTVAINSPGWTKSFGTISLRGAYEAFHPSHIIELVQQGCTVTFIQESSPRQTSEAAEDQTIERLECVKVSDTTRIIRLQASQIAKTSYIARGNNFLAHLCRTQLEGVRLINQIGLLGKAIETEFGALNVSDVAEHLRPRLSSVLRTNTTELDKLKYLRRSLADSDALAFDTGSVWVVMWSDSVVDQGLVGLEPLSTVDKRILEAQLCGMLAVRGVSEGAVLTPLETVSTNNVAGLDTLSHPFIGIKEKREPPAKHHTDPSTSDMEFAGICYVQRITQNRIQLVTATNMKDYKTIVLLRPIDGAYQTPRVLSGYDINYVEMRQKDLSFKT